MRLLLDTHTFLWFAEGIPKLSPVASGLLADPQNVLFLSHVSAWEVVIKVGLKKLTLGRSLDSIVTTAVTGYRLQLISLALDDCYDYLALPFPLPNHRDPFDRMLITQALRLNLDVVGADASFDAYGVTRHW